MDLINNDVGIRVGTQLVADGSISVDQIRDQTWLFPENYLMAGHYLRQAAFDAVINGQTVFLDAPIFPLAKRAQSG